MNAEELIQAFIAWSKQQKENMCHLAIFDDKSVNVCKDENDDVVLQFENFEEAIERLREETA